MHLPQASPLPPPPTNVDPPHRRPPTPRCPHPTRPPLHSPKKLAPRSRSAKDCCTRYAPGKPPHPPRSASAPPPRRCHKRHDPSLSAYRPPAPETARPPAPRSAQDKTPPKASQTAPSGLRPHWPDWPPHRSLPPSGRLSAVTAKHTAPPCSPLRSVSLLTWPLNYDKNRLS